MNHIDCGLRMSIDQLWEKAVGGDKDAEEKIFQHLLDRFKVLARLVVCKEDAQDVAHEACLEVIKGYKAVREPFEYNAWAQQILKHKIADYYKKKSMENNVFTTQGNTQQYERNRGSGDDPEVMRILIDCLRKLIVGYPRYARALNLVQLGYKTEEICEKMNIKRANLYVILNRGRSLLKNCMYGSTK